MHFLNEISKFLIVYQVIIDFKKQSLIRYSCTYFTTFIKILSFQKKNLELVCIARFTKVFLC